MTEDDWANIPEPGDLRAVGKKMRKERQKERERFSAVPDSVLLGAHAQTQFNSSVVDASGIATPLSSSVTGTETPIADFRQISKARDDLLKVKLDQASSDSASGKTTVDPKGYLTDLNSIVLKTDAEIGDIKKARELLKSVITTNPKHAPGWIAAARLEEIDGKMGPARSIIARGCEECPKNEDVWLEAARLNTPDNAKIILANAVREIPQAVKIWLHAADLETEPKVKKRILRKALEFVPNSVKLWKAAIELEDDVEDARIMLSRAVECVPLSVDLWLALARLETFENAQKVLNRARVACPSSYEIWVAAARLADSAGEEDKVDIVINGAVRALSKIGANLSREKWLEEAEKCEKTGNIIACQAIVRAVIGQDVDEEDREEVWLEDAEACANRGSVATARAIYVHALKEFLDDEHIWQQAAFFEKQHGTYESLEELLKRAVRYCPRSEVLWLMGAKEKW
jgi:pre-mRNA-processing factor 6